MSDTIIKVDNVIKDFMVGEQPIHIIKGMSLDVFPGDFVMIYGPSGCGKSTFLNIMNGWEDPTSGTVTVFGEDIYKKSEDERAKMKHNKISLVHQSSNWVKALNVLENIAIPYLLAGRTKKEGFDRGMKLLQMLHLDKYAHYKPMDLSGGQQQRVSFLRALVNNPEIIMADEPTGNLDTSSSQVIMELFSKINHELGRTIVMVTHNLELLKFANKTVNIIDGKIVKVEENTSYEKVKIGEKKDVLEIAFNQFVDKDEEKERELSKIQ